ncbi:MAG: hypothetical protein LUE93_07020 [Bacteroides sp.]|nr:hypothetical protein [Bacteroides sp.]
MEFDDLSLEEEVTVKTIGSGKVQPEIEAIQVVEFRDEENETSQTKQEAVVEKEEKKEEPVEKRFEDNSGIEESSFAFTEKESVSIVEEHKNKEEFQDTGSVDLPEIVPPEKRRGVWIIPFILIVIGGIAALFFFVDLNMDTHKSSPSVYLLADSVFPESTANASETVIPIPDTISLDPDAMEDKLEVVVTAPVTTVSNSPVIENKRYAENKKYTISGTKAIHTVKQGERLTVIALQYYGTKKLWPYIVEHNKGVITNPDVVPYGTVIKIPELK